MTQLPADFVAEAEHALAHDDRAHLILQSLEIDGLAWEAKGKAFLETLLARTPSGPSLDRVVLFTGHRIDSPGRSTSRFPPEAEPLASEAIRKLLTNQQRQGHVNGLAGGANGGDILFLEACRELGIPFEMLLVLPEAQFIEESVAAPGNWVERFQVLAREVQPRILAQSKDLPHWLADKGDYSIWARNNLWMIATALSASPRHFILAALWNGGTGDGPGGTEHMVQVAQQHGAEFIHLDTRQLFKQPSTHTAEQ